jgi:hypothetical protein
VSLKVVRAGLVRFAAGVLTVQLAGLAAALSAVCCGEHSHGATTMVCTMAHEPGATCPMHHPPSPKDHASHVEDGAESDAPVLVCGCSDMAGVQALTGAAGVLTPSYELRDALALLGSVVPSHIDRRQIIQQVSSPPPRI